MGGVFDLIPVLAVVDDRQPDHLSHDAGSAAVVLSSALALLDVASTPGWPAGAAAM